MQNTIITSSYRRERKLEDADADVEANETSSTKIETRKV